MAGKHRTIGKRARRIALLSAAAATASAMTVGVTTPTPTPSAARVATDPVDLAAAIRLLPNSDQVPDLTGGLGNAAYDFGQGLADPIIRAVVNGINLSALAQAAGLDPKSLLTTLLADLPANLLPGILASLSLDIPVLGPVLDALSGGDLALLTQILDLLGVDEVTGGTLTGLLALLGLDLSDPLNLSGLDVPGLNVITPGATFAALKMLGLDLGWLPALPNSVANEINGTDYAKLGVNGVLNEVLDRLVANPLLDPLGLLTGQLRNLINGLTSGIPDVIDVRVPVTIGIGMGAFAAAMSYEKVLEQLKFQPGGSQYAGLDPLLGSLTILPMVLINNPGRPDGGMFARFGPLAALFGINTVNPHTQATSDGLGVPILGTGVTLGAANLLPILVDATYEYQPLSDFASWPNPFTLGNNLGAALMPTYMLRGLSLDGIGDQVLGQVKDLVEESVLTGNPLALNVYLTLHSATSPSLEPLYLASDLLNLVGLGPLAAIPMKLANALAPAINTLVNVGYANTTRNPDGTYTRDFTNAGTETPFLSFPDLDFGKVPGDVINQLVGGFTKEFFSANPTPGTPNVLANLLNALLGGGLGGILPGAAQTPGGTPSAANPLGGLTSLLNNLLGGLLGGLTPQAAQQTPAALTASSIPSTTSRMVALSANNDAAEADSVTEEAKDATTEPKAEEPKAEEPKAEQPAAEESTTEKPVAEEPAAEEPAVEKPTAEEPTAEKPKTEEPKAEESKTEESTGPKHAKPDDEAAPAASGSTTPKHAKPDQDESADGTDGGTTTVKTPKHAKPSLNVVRDSVTAKSPTDAKPDVKSGADTGKKDAAAGSDDSADGASSNAA
jgi:hypothetical protein